MSDTDKRYYKINIDGNDHIFTNVLKDGDHYVADNVDENGKPTYTSTFYQSEIDRAVISNSMTFVEKPADFVFRLRLVNASEYDNGNKDTSDISLEFPAQANEIENALAEIGLPPDAKPGQYFIDDCACILKSLNPLVSVYTDVHELAETAKRLDTLDGFEMMKLNAVMETDAAFENLAQIKEFTYNCDYYDFELDVHDYTDLGLRCIYQSGVCESMPDYYKDAIEPTAFGKYIAEAERGIFTTRGYLHQTGDEWETVELENFKPKPLTVGADEHEIDTTEKFAADLDGYFREYGSEYDEFVDDEIRAKRMLADFIRTGKTAELRERIKAVQEENYIGDEEMEPFLRRIENFERCKGIEYSLENGTLSAAKPSIKEQLRETKQDKQQPKPPKKSEPEL